MRQVGRGKEAPVNRCIPTVPPLGRGMRPGIAVDRLGSRRGVHRFGDIDRFCRAAVSWSVSGCRIHDS